MCTIMMYRARRAEARIRQMLWKVNYSDILFINSVSSVCFEVWRSLHLRTSHLRRLSDGKSYIFLSYC